MNVFSLQNNTILLPITSDDIRWQLSSLYFQQGCTAAERGHQNSRWHLSSLILIVLSIKVLLLKGDITTADIPTDNGDFEGWSTIEYSIYIYAHTVYQYMVQYVGGCYIARLLHCKKSFQLFKCSIFTAQQFLSIAKQLIWSRCRNREEGRGSFWKPKKYNFNRATLLAFLPTCSFNWAHFPHSAHTNLICLLCTFLETRYVRIEGQRSLTCSCAGTRLFQH